MRRRFYFNISFGSIPIKDVKIPLNSRDELPPILAALQEIFTNNIQHEKIFTLLEEDIKKHKSLTGRRGMDLWHVLVLASMRVGLGMNFDRLEDIANHHVLVRQIMGINDKWDNTVFHHNTIRDNYIMLKPKTLKAIINLISCYGRTVLGSENSKLKTKTDSYVFETNVHFPTDLNLSWDCFQKCINLITSNDKLFSLGGFRKYKSWIKRSKELYRTCSCSVYSGGKNKEERLKKSVSSYLENLVTISSKIALVMTRAKDEKIDMQKLEAYHHLLDKHIDLISRRLIKNEVIPHNEKLFSIYEQHTEWINKGKRHPSVELGHRILITTDENDLIVDFKVMLNETDEQQVEGSFQRIESLFGQNSIESMSFDKGFSSLANKMKILPHTDILCMPKKGKKNQKEIEEERDATFVKLRHQHSAIESDINCLEHHGLDKCPDKGIEGYTRYAYIGILSYNLHKIGNCILSRRRESLLKAA